MNYNQAAEFGLQRLIALRLTTPGGLPAPTVAPEMFPCLVLENDRPEWGFLKGERLMVGVARQPADVANVSQAALFNPAGSNVIVTVEGFDVTTQTAWQLNRGTGILPTAGVTAPRDFRNAAPSINQNGVGVVTFGPFAAAPNFPFYTSDLAANLQIVQQTYVLAPGTSLLVSNQAVNSVLLVNFFWRERAVQPGELG